MSDVPRALEEDETNTSKADVISRLSAESLRRFIVTFRDLLRSHQDALNALNVYPVPDGDTGTNMALTLESVVSELEGAESLSEICRAISHGSLMGARGNSGVILCQLLRGLSAEFLAAESIDARTVVRGLESASRAAYSSVQRPIEGTILTVARESSEAARSGLDDGRDLLGVLEVAREEARASLERTPDLLSALREAGVVDAGGAGFVLMLDSALHVVDGRPLPEPPAIERPQVNLHPHDHAGEDPSDLRYEVMYFLEAKDELIPEFREVWAGIGDSIVVVGGEGTWNCHIHTNDIGGAIEAALDIGRPRRIRVTDLIEQVEEESWVVGGESSDESSLSNSARCAVVAIATGDGVRRIFRSLGVHELVAGGQSMNPSTAQILEAVEKVAADEVVILPNNKNIVAVAEQVAGLTSKQVRVLPSRSVAEGFAALIAYDPDSDAGDNLVAMREQMSQVTSCEVTKAVRDTSTEAGDVREGDWIGLSRSGVISIGSELYSTVCDLLRAVLTDQHSLVTFIEGEGSSASVTRRVTTWLSEHFPEVEAEIHQGNQPLYPYLIGVE